MVMSAGLPSQSSALTGTTVYTTLTFAEVVLIQASSAITLAARPVPVAGAPAEAVSPLELMAVIVYVAAATPLELTASVMPVAPRLHTVVPEVAITGSGLT